MDIIINKSMYMVCRLGGFHTLMSYMGSIGTMMKGSGLDEALSTVYGENAVQHMMSGKAFARALRGHFLVESALTNKLISHFVPQQHRKNLPVEDNIEHPESLDINSSDETDETASDDYELDVDICATDNEKSFNEEEIKKLSKLYEVVKAGKATSENILNSAELKKLKKNITDLKIQLAEQSRTAQLWLQYLEYIQVLKLFYRAERTGNWELHLFAVRKMINLFAATGHINYAKCARLYLQFMLKLPSDYPWLNKYFVENGYHTIRKSDR